MVHEYEDTKPDATHAMCTDITEDLLRMERAHFSSDYKFGVLYYRKDQTENEMFSNCTITRHHSLALALHVRVIEISPLCVHLCACLLCVLIPQRRVQRWRTS
jgi:hypothetical protein